MKTRMLLLLAGVFVVGGASPTLADRPQSVPVDDTYLDLALSEQLGFPVQVRIQGSLIVRGRDLSSTQFSHVTQSLTNLMTGRTVVMQCIVHQLQSVKFDPGTNQIRFVYVSNGAVRLVVPGMGAVYIEAGRSEQTLVFDADTSELISADMSIKGRHPEFDLEAIYSLLTL